MAWIRIDDQMVDHPKIRPLSAEAFLWLHRGLSYANRFLTNGELFTDFMTLVPPAIVDELTTVRPGQKNPVWHLAKNGHAVIHDFRDYQPTKSEVERERKKNRKRQAKWRAAIGKNKRVSHAVINGAPARPSPARSVPPVVPQGGRARKRTRRGRPDPFVAADPVAVQQQIETRRRREAMAADGMSPEDIEAVFEREHDARKQAS